METPENDYGRALSVDAESIGQPGNRRFRLLVRSDNRAATIWMEKQQLAGIGDWIVELLTRLDKEKPSSERDVQPEPFGAIFDLDFRASQVGLGYTEDEDTFTIQAFDIEAQRQTPSFRCLISRGQARVLCRKIADVIAGGRPICPLCQAPIEPEGHVCPRSNGHHA